MPDTPVFKIPLFHIIVALIVDVPKQTAGYDKIGRIIVDVQHLGDADTGIFEAHIVPLLSFDFVSKAIVVARLVVDLL